MAAVSDRYSVLKASYNKTRCDLLLYWAAWHLARYCPHVGPWTPVDKAIHSQQPCGYTYHFTREKNTKKWPKKWTVWEYWLDLAAVVHLLIKCTLTIFPSFPSSITSQLSDPSAKLWRHDAHFTSRGVAYLSLLPPCSQFSKSLQKTLHQLLLGICDYLGHGPQIREFSRVEMNHHLQPVISYPCAARRGTCEATRHAAHRLLGVENI